ncbi:MAG: molybdopterin-dependent oxidoreductase, partial [Anaerolineae bacterium]|nr:molybdopterin-dependent oxidoreductase [Anaerolineae bacterium]
MTNHWIDLKNSDCVFIIGGNPAENHPASFYWILEAVERNGAPLIVVDPRFNRSASKATLYAPLRPGTDIAFLGGIIHYVLENELYHKEYVLHYTDASFLLDPNFQGPAELDGLFSGYDEAKRAYDRATWKYQTDANGEPLRDPTLQDPNCVFQHLKRHYARYTPEMVSRITGCPQDLFLKVAQTFAETGKPGKAGTILYAMGQTQHTVGSQNVRAMAMLQLLLGNIGVPGGGVNALRGESNVQGSTDMAVLFHILPGYMPTPTAKDHPTLQAYLEARVKAAGKSYWQNTPKFLVSLLKAWWGDAAVPENDFCYDYLGKLGPKNYSWISLFHAMYEGKIKGLWIMGQNPAVSGPNARMERAALAKLDWMVVQELFDTETCSFWQAPGVNPAEIKTEVFVLPAADAMEKAGSIVTSGRLIQWRPKVAEPPGEAKEDIWILDRIYRAVRELYQHSTDPKDRPILDLNWDCGDPPDVERVAREINGYWTRDVLDEQGNVVGRKGELLDTFGKLRDDGSTASGNWLYCGYYYPRDDGNGHTLP